MNNVGKVLNTDGVVRAMSEMSKEEGRPLSQQDAHNALNLLKKVVADALVTGQKVQITGFVSFNASYRSPRKGYNVVTNEPMDIPGCVVVSAKAGKSLKDAIHGLDDDVFEAIKSAS